MDRLFRVDFYPHEWLSLTGHMTPEQRGVFVQICAQIYAKRGRILNDAAHIGRFSNCSSRAAKSIIDQLILSKDLQVHGEFIGQKRCEDELNKKRTHLEHSAKGGRTKAENGRENKENSNLTSSGTDDSLSTPIAIAIASPIVEITSSNEEVVPAVENELSLLPKVSFGQMVEAWNKELGDVCPSVKALTPDRKRLLAARFKDTFHHSLEHWTEYLRVIRQSDFLIGKSDKGWRADLDWALKTKSISRVMEGFYNGGQGAGAESEHEKALKILRGQT
jgi:uncharacterized protein YdaU (DUF1376 family)